MNLNYPFTTPSNYTYDSDDIDVTAGKTQLKLQQADVDFTESFDDDTDFTYDNTKAEFTGGLVRQKLYEVTGLSFNEDFADDTDFVYDSDLAEFTGGLVRQKNKRLTDETFYASYNTDINGNVGNGVLTGTPAGGASVSGGKLDLTGGGAKYVDYNADLNADSQQVGCIRLRWIPNYNGTPPTDYPIFSILKADSDTNNIIMLRHESGGVWKIFIEDYTGSNIMSASLPSWSATLGVEVELELNWDLTTGATRLFINGTQWGNTQTDTGVRDANITILRIGSNYNGVQLNNCYINDVLVFSTVQHTSNYTPDWTNIYEYDYIASKVELPTMTYAGVSLNSFTGFPGTEVNAPKYVIDDKYWSGAAWVSSDGSYSQANTLSDVNTNISSLTPSGTTVNVDIVFDNSNTLSSVADLTVNYTGNTYLESAVILPEMEHTEDGTIKLFNSFTTTEAGSPRYTLQIGRSGNYLYWNGVAWVVSDGTYTQANDVSTFNTNCDTLPVNGEEYGQFKIIFPDAIILSSVSELTANMNVDIGYLTTNPTIEVNTTFRTDELTNYIETATKNGSDEIKAVLKKNSTYYYHNGTSWVESDETYSQSNTATEILTYISTFTTIGVNVKVKWFLHSDDGTTTPYLDNIYIEYDFSGESPTLSTITYYGYLKSIVQYLTDESIKVRAAWTIGDKTIMTDEWETIDTDSQGYWEYDLTVEDVDPTYLEWWIQDTIYRTDFINNGDGTQVKFSELTITSTRTV